VERSTLFVFPPDVPLRVCSAEDLIVMKAFAARAKDWLDMEGVLIRQGGQLDWPYILRQLRPLVELKGSPEILAELERRRKECEC
jgi:hypothetical protein